jgi:hypothetical protein
MAVTEETIRSYLQRKGSPLASNAGDFIEVGNKYGVDPRFLVAVSGIETGFGKAGAGVRNPFGWNSARKYSGPREVLELIGQGLTKQGGYYSGKDTIDAIGATWAPPGAQNDAGGNSGWPAAVRKFYSELGGNPSGKVKGSGAATGVGGTTTTTLPGSTPTTGTTVVSPEAIEAINRYVETSRADVLSGRRPAGVVESGEFDRIQSGIQVINPGPGMLGTKQDGVTPSEMPGIAPNGNQPKLSKGGAPHSGTHTLGNWQSDMAYDLFGKTGTAVRLPSEGTIVKVSGSPGGNPRFAGYGVTIRVAGGQAFFKHLGSLGPNVKVGQRLPAGALIGTLDGTVNGGPHLHLGAENRRLLEQLTSYYASGK